MKEKFAIMKTPHKTEKNLSQITTLPNELLLGPSEAEAAQPS